MGAPLDATRARIHRVHDAMSLTDRRLARMDSGDCGAGATLREIRERLARAQLESRAGICESAGVPAVASHPDPVDTRRCWVCGADDVERYKERSVARALVPSDLAITDSNYGSTLALRRCRRCSFIFAEGSDLRELLGLYEKLSDPGYEGSQDSRVLQMRWLIERALRARPGAKTLLDIGAAAGLLVKLAREQGLDAQGVEPSHDLVAAAARLYDVELIQGTIPHKRLRGARFDIVFLADVIEHVPDPVALLRDARELVGAGGVLLVVTPDVGSFARRLLGKRWWHFRVAHVGYFDADSLGEACARAGLSVTSRFRAKWFFRVSYLAERVLRYLPVGAVERLLHTTTVGRRVGDVVVPLNLFDSWAFVCKRDDDGE